MTLGRTPLPDVIIAGAGVIGCATAYYLAREGCSVTVVERESIASGASGVAAAMISQTFEGDPLADLSDFSRGRHAELARDLPAETGTDYGYRINPELYAAFSPDAARDLKASEDAFRARNPRAHWVEGPELWEIEPRLNPAVLGAIVGEQAQVIASRFTTALATAAEARGARFRHGSVAGLGSAGNRVTGVRLATGEVVAGETVILAMGAWSAVASRWTGLQVPVFPVRGQILRLEAPDPQLRTAIYGPEMYVLLKADGSTLAGATHEPEAGFDAVTTPEGLERVMEAAIEIAPFLAEAKLVHHLVGLRPGTADDLPLLGPVAGWEGLFMATGHFWRGIELSAGSARAVADLVLGLASPVDLSAFDPARFGATA